MGEGRGERLLKKLVYAKGAKKYEVEKKFNFQKTLCPCLPFIFIILK